MISSQEMERSKSLTPEQILAQVDAMRTMILQSFGGDKQAYEKIRANDPLRKPAVSFPPVLQAT